MTALTCAAARRRLQAYHDRELTVGDEIAVSAHLQWCEACTALLADFELVGMSLQMLAPGRAAMLSRDEAAGFTSTVVSRMQAEDDASWFSTLRLMFEDMHLVYAGLGAATATAVCLVIMLSMMRFATTDRPDSLAAVLTVLATPLECESGNDIMDASGCRARWNERFARANEYDEQEAVFALEAVVTRHGRLANLAGMRAAHHRAALSDLQVIEELLDVVSRSRLDPRLSNRLPMPLWLFEQTTVRATKQPAPLDVPLPAKKRVAIGGRAGVARA
jgi:Putative zinc-finger